MFRYIQFRFFETNVKRLKCLSYLQVIKISKFDYDIQPNNYLN